MTRNSFCGIYINNYHDASLVFGPTTSARLSAVHACYRRILYDDALEIIWKRRINTTALLI